MKETLPAKIRYRKKHLRKKLIVNKQYKARCLIET